MPLAASAASQGSAELPGAGAVPPKPVAAPPLGMTALPAASIRSVTSRPLAESRTTRVWIVPAVSLTWPDHASVPPLACTIHRPGLAVP